MSSDSPKRRYRYASKRDWVSTARDGDRLRVRRPPALEASKEQAVESTESWVIDDLMPMTAVITGDVERAIYDHDFAMRMKAARLARARRAPDWAEQWLAIEDEYKTRRRRARSLLGDWVTSVALHDGHLAEVVLTARAFVERGEELLSRAPWVRHLHLTSYANVGPSLFTRPTLRGMQSMGLRVGGLEDADVAALVASPFVDGLRWLDLAYNRLGERSLEAVACCPTLARLEYLAFEGNAVASPIDDIGTDAIDGAVVYTTCTQAGRALERQAGRSLNWLHAPAHFPHSYPPSPLDVAMSDWSASERSVVMRSA